MGDHRIAILTDTGTDTPASYIQQNGVYLLPLTIRYSEGEYQDGVNITGKDVYDRLETEVPQTSLPSGDIIDAVFRQIMADGYTQVLIISLSSGLSGTFNMIKIMTADYPQLDCRLIDTKNISIGAGFTVMEACRLVGQGLPIDEIERRLHDAATHTKVFFCLATLEYLRKGGRIGMVTATLGSLLDLKPVISCNDEGVYYTVSKAIGRARSLHTLVKKASEYVKAGQRYRLAIIHGAAPDEAAETKAAILKLLPDSVEIIEGEVGPALGVHTGPGLMGIGIQILAD